MENVRFLHSFQPVLDVLRALAHGGDLFDPQGAPPFNSTFRDFAHYGPAGDCRKRFDQFGEVLSATKAAGLSWLPTAGHEQNLWRRFAASDALVHSCSALLRSLTLRRSLTAFFPLTHALTHVVYRCNLLSHSCAAPLSGEPGLGAGPVQIRSPGAALDLSNVHWEGLAPFVREELLQVLAKHIFARVEEQIGIGSGDILL